MKTQWKVGDRALCVLPCDEELGLVEDMLYLVEKVREYDGDTFLTVAGQTSFHEIRFRQVIPLCDRVNR